MGAGGKTELITIERETRTRRTGGDYDSAWTTLGQMWAAVDYAGGSETQTRGAVRETMRYKFTVYAEAVLSHGMTQADRIVWNGTTYNVREVPRRVIGTPDMVIASESGVTQ
ncbi:MAG: head-tail adaptor protein [Hyphomicrobiaceae bacterium]